MHLLRIILLFIAFFGVGFQNLFSQNHNDSLLRIFNNTSLEDTNRLKAIDKIAKEYLFKQPDSAIYYAEKQLAFAKKTANLNSQAEALQNIGTSYYVKQHIDTSIIYYKESLALYKKSKNKLGEASIYNNIGIMYEIKGQYSKAINYYLDGLAIREKTNNIKSISRLNINIGNVYTQLEEFDKAYSYYKKAKNGFTQSNDSSGVAKTLMAIGLTFMKTQEYDSSVSYFNKSLFLHEKLNDLKGVHQCKSNLGTIYKYKKEYSIALEYFNQSLAYFKQTDDALNNSTLFESMGSLYIELKEYQKSIELCSKSLELSKKHSYIEIEKASCNCLYRAYSNLNNSTQALKYFTKYIEIKDSIRNEDLTRKIAQSEIQHEYDKKIFADSLASAEKERIKQLNHQQEIEQQKTYTYAGVIGLILMFIIVLVVLRGYAQKKKSNKLLKEKSQLILNQKIEVEKQKQTIEEKSTEISDSINYAKRIQSAILPQQSLIKNCLPKSFILFEPKDVVSGDFYWVEKTKDIIVFCVADCTGHGVPGAMVSVVCSNALHKAVVEFNLIHPNEILNKVRDIVVSTFEKSDDNVQDGMDISLCSLNLKTNELEYSGANNPLWVLQNGREEMLEVKADKQPIGAHFNSQPFTNHKLSLNKGDRIYLFSDGYIDQFGGDKGKKLKSKPFKNYLIESSTLALEKQKEFLATKFSEWKGSVKQIDDVCVMGIEV